ncbi:MAG: HAD-IA family hydrolase [Lautropia sp.]
MSTVRRSGSTPPEDGAVDARVEAVIWDFGGVITSSPFDAFERFERERGLPPGFLRRVNATDPHENAWARLERAEIDHDAFDDAFARESRAQGAEVRGLDVLALIAGELRPAMVEALRRVSARLKTGCITNNFVVPAHADTGIPYRVEVMACFDHVIESAKTGLRKPDPRIYRMMADALGVDARACVYLDDLGVNLKPAREMGMRTIKVGDPDAAIDDLERLVGFTLRPAAG